MFGIYTLDKITDTTVYVKQNSDNQCANTSRVQKSHLLSAYLVCGHVATSLLLKMISSSFMPHSISDEDEEEGR